MSKSVLITGAARRIGRHLALRLASQGWNVAVHYNRSREDAEAAVAEIAGNGVEAVALQADLQDTDAPDKLISQACDAVGTPECLINNASTFDYDEASSLTREGWRRQLGVNLEAPVFLSQAFAAALPGGRSGNIVNILDERVWKLAPTHFSYTIAKSALWTATRTLAQAFAPDIRVNAIGPGPTLPNARQTQREFERENESMLLKRGTTPDEIADAMEFILAAPAMTGQMIALDGGQHLLWQTPDMHDYV